MPFAAGQKLRVSDLTGGTGGSSGSPVGSGVVIMSSDVTVNNTTTVTDATGLTFSVIANATYQFEAWLRYNGGSTPDIKFQWSSPSGTTGFWSLVGHARDTSPALDTGAGGTWVVEAIGTSKTVAGDATGTLLLAATAKGYITTTTAGTFKLQVAQRTATASNTVLRTGSYMSLTRIA